MIANIAHVDRRDAVIDAPGETSSGRHALVVVDTCRLFREGLIGILRHSCFDVVTAAAEIHGALAEVDRSEAGRIDLLICSLDPQRGIDTQLTAIRAVRHRDPATKTVLLMPSCSAEDLVAAVLCGVDGVILKDISGEKLISALDLVMHGQHVLPLGVASQVFARLQPAQEAAFVEHPVVGATHERFAAPRPANDVPPAKPVSEAATVVCAGVFEAADVASARERKSVAATRNLGLSDRETQILQCLIEGSANKLIARRLDIAEATVKVHIKGLLRKINVSNRTQAAIWALNQSVALNRTRNEPTFEPKANAVPPAEPAAEPALSELIAVFPPVINERAQPAYA